VRTPDWLRRRPWLAVLALYVFVVAAYAAFVFLAQRNPPLPAEGYVPPAP
jgi:hypothetical protein